MNGFTVDPAVLRRLVTTLRSIDEQLDQLAVTEPLSPEETGHARLAHSVSDFTGRWGEARKQLGQRIKDCTDHLESAISAYCQTEDDVVQAFGGNR
ncbi:hypothetical protein [Amycolatopsis kentuckyensis]|uniref:hypothetical protein n=1 Tax=Amycolatopsis kentuckyensis TaxID=218823 RepID=UPI003567B152